MAYVLPLVSHAQPPTGLGAGVESPSMADRGEKRTFQERPCTDCGRPMKVHPRAGKSQKYCGVCRLARAALWHDGREATCRLCDRKYIAWTGLQGFPTCGFCFMERASMGGRESEQHECAFHGLGTCHSSTATATPWVYHPNLPICHPDLTDPAKFKQNRATILAQYKVLRAKP